MPYIVTIGKRFYPEIHTTTFQGEVLDTKESAEAFVAWYKKEFMEGPELEEARFKVTITIAEIVSIQTVPFDY